MAKVLIVGCGAIGSELAGVLLTQGHNITGLKRKPPLSEPGPINYVAADISSSADLADLADLDGDFTEAFFIVSPDGRTEQSYRAIYETGLNNLLDKLPDTHWLMVSSTSVYGQTVAIGREPMRPTVKAVGADASMNKRCSNARLKSLGYQFQYPSYRDGYLELIAAREG